MFLKGRKRELALDSSYHVPSPARRLAFISSEDISLVLGIFPTFTNSKASANYENLIDLLVQVLI